MSQEQDKIFFRNYTLVLIFIAVMMVVFIIAARMIGTDEEALAKQKESMIAKRTEPAGQVSMVGDEPVAVAAADSGDAAGGDGKSVYDGLCVACHGVPGIGAPVVGNAEEWTARIAKGIDSLYSNAINGYTGEQGYMMPARGGGNLSDDEVKAAVDYMVEQSGGGSAAAGGETTAAAGKSGEEVYNGMCVACHSVPGIGAPVVGKPEDWTSRMEKGIEMVYINAINGFTGESGLMPPRGGGNFTDEEVKAAVDYMLEKSQ